MQKVFKSQEELTYSNIHLRNDDRQCVVNMRLKPLPTKKGQVMLVGVFIEEVRSESRSSRTSPET